MGMEEGPRRLGVRRSVERLLEQAQKIMDGPAHWSSLSCYRGGLCV